MVIWLTGLAGSGKSTIGRALCRLWKAEAPNTVLVDGDEVRRLLGRDRDEDAYTLDGRREVAARIAALCAWLDGQDINVVCCTISPFAELHRRNRQTFSRYFEVFVDTPMAVIERRDRSALYARARRGEIRNVIGVDLPFEAPRAPDMVVDNAPERADLAPLAAQILARAKAA